MNKHRLPKHPFRFSQRILLKGLRMLILTLSMWALVGATIATESHLTSEENIQSIIGKVIKAYGGRALTEAKTIKITDYNKGIWPGESESPETPDVWRINEELTIDFVNKRKSLLSYRVPRTTIDLEKWIYDGNTTTKYDLLHNKYSIEDWADYENLGSSIVRSSDTMQARRLVSNLTQGQYIGDEFFRGRQHHKIAITLTNGRSFTYFIDVKSGLISKIRRPLGSGEMLYVFSNHQVTQQVSYARDLNIFVNGALRLMSVERNIELNLNVEEAFSEIPESVHWGKTFDRSTMTVRQVGNSVYQVGQGYSLNVFIEQPEFFIALGDARALNTNFEQLRNKVNSDKPIRYFVVTHHHNANIRGLENVFALGAKLVVSEAHQSVLKGLASEKFDEKHIIVVAERSQLTVGDLTLFDIATAHSQHYLLAYLPFQKIVIAEDHYVTELSESRPRVYRDMVRFREALDELAISVDKLIDIKGWREISKVELDEWADTFEEKRCPAGYRVCSRG